METLEKDRDKMGDKSKAFQVSSLKAPFSKLLGKFQSFSYFPLKTEFWSNFFFSQIKQDQLMRKDEKILRTYLLLFLKTVMKNSF